MAIKTIEYTVTADGVSPNFEIMAGMQYDHKRTELQFKLEDGFYDSILEQLGENTVVYRFDCYDGEGKLHTGELKKVTSNILEPYALEYWVTKFGGKLKVQLVITVTNEESAKNEWSYEVVLCMENLPEAEVDEKGYTSMSTLALKTADLAREVEEKYGEVLSMHQKLTLLEKWLQDGEWVFDGQEGNEIDVNFIVDEAFDINSTNALQNKMITKRFDMLEESVRYALNNACIQVYNSVVSELKDEILKEAHPVGSYYWSDNMTNPAILFGGEWQRVENVFVLAAGSEYGIGTSGGEKVHTLTENEMPKHYHMFKPDAKFDGIDFIVPTKSDGGGWSCITESCPQDHTGHYPGHWAKDTWGTYEKGGSKAHNNMPPYITAYCWKRTA